MKDGKEDCKLMKIIEERATNLDKKPSKAWLTFGAKLPGFEEE